MSESLPSPTLYQVNCSERVRQELHSFTNAALEHGFGPEYLAGLKEIGRRLRIYPQFGEPLADLQLKPAQLWIGAVWPLVLRYTLDEERHLIWVVASFLLVPSHGT